jgi:hypothetical protein
MRKAAFQEFVVTTEYNSARVPTAMPVLQAAVIGVAFVAAALGLGICLGVTFSGGSGTFNGPDLFNQVRRAGQGSLAADIQEECLNGITEAERAKAGDWIVIWGGDNILLLLSCRS